MPWSTFRKNESHSDFWFVDAGEPLDDPLQALPYMGPNWYWRDNAVAILRHGYSKIGKITWTSFKYVLEAGEPTHNGCLTRPYASIQNIVQKAMSGKRCQWTFEDRPYTEEAIDDMYKGLILAMQGVWTSQHTYCWKVCNARYEEDAPAAVHMWRPNHDGTRRLMMRNEVLTKSDDVTNWTYRAGP